MKKLIALLLVLCTVFSLCACGSSGKKKNIDEITEDDLYAAADQLMEAEEEETEAVETTEDIPPIEDYLVTVELTPESFDEYFEYVEIHELDSWGEPLEGDWMIFGFKSKAYENGLILYDTEDTLVELYTTNIYGKEDCTNMFFPGALGIYKESSYEHDNCTGNVHTENLMFSRIGRCKGTVTFVKSDYVVSYESVSEKTINYQYPYRSYRITLKDGSVLTRDCKEGFLY